jgi:hypothetical protein
MGTVNSFPWVTAAGRIKMTTYLSPSDTRLRQEWSYTSPSPCIVLAWCLITYKDDFHVFMTVIIYLTDPRHTVLPIVLYVCKSLSLALRRKQIEGVWVQGAVGNICTQGATRSHTKLQKTTHWPDPSFVLLASYYQNDHMKWYEMGGAWSMHGREERFR